MISTSGVLMQTIIINETINLNQSEILELSESEAALIRLRFSETFNPVRAFSYANGDHLEASIENERKMRESNK